MSVVAAAVFRYEPDPDDPAWMVWELTDTGRFNHLLGPFRVRREGERARCRIFPTRQHSNLSDAVHGAVVMSFADVSLFAGARTLDIADAGQAVTLDCNVQFLAPGVVGEPLDAVVEVLAETRRLVFLRGIIEQEARRVAAFSATIRKVTPRQ